MHEGQNTIPSQLNITLKFIETNGNSAVYLLARAKQVPSALTTLDPTHLER
jgi:hypothetical protein